MTLCQQCADEAIEAFKGVFEVFGAISTDITGLAAELGALSAMVGVPTPLTSSEIGTCQNEGGSNATDQADAS
jgi:hypothetical protein